MNIRDIGFCERQRSLIDEILHDGRSDRPDEVKRSLVRLEKSLLNKHSAAAAAQTVLTIASTLLCLNARSVGTNATSQQAWLYKEAGRVSLTVVNLDRAVNVERDLQVLEGIEDRIVNVELLPATGDISSSKETARP